MSSHINAYILPADFSEARYGAFVGNSRRILGCWKKLDERPMTLTGESRLHEYCLTNDDPAPEWDWENERSVSLVEEDVYKRVRVDVSLRRNRISEEPAYSRFSHLICLEHGHGLMLSWMVYWIVAASVFDYFKGACVEDLNKSDDPHNLPFYTTKDEWLAHVLRLCNRWWPADKLVAAGFFDAEGHLTVGA